MKKLFALLLVLIALPAAALGDLPDISGLSYTELVQLKDQINLAMWNSQEWQEVTVPPGIYEIGKDIPAGHWSMIATKGDGPVSVIYASALAKDGHQVDFTADNYGYIAEDVCDPASEYYDASCKTIIDFDLKAGFFLQIESTLIFTPYAGKPDLGFK